MVGAVVDVGPAVEVGTLITTVAPGFVGRSALVGVRLLLLENTKPAPITQQIVTTMAAPIPMDLIRVLGFFVGGVVA
jgi:hypothetical protein